MLKLSSIFFIIHLSTVYGAVSESRTNFDITRLDKCASDGRLKYSFNITKKNHEQYLDVYLMSQIPLDSNIGLNSIIETSLDGHTFLPLFTIREKDFCKALNRYLGEFWYDIERAAQILPGTCPILQGRYHVHHLLLNFSKITLQTFPFGTLRFTIRAIDKRINTTVFCIIVEVTNMPN